MRKRSTSARERSTKVKHRSVYVRWTARVFSGLRSPVRWLSEPAAGRQRVEEFTHDRAGLLVVDEAQKRHEAERDRPVAAEVLLLSSAGSRLRTSPGMSVSLERGGGRSRDQDQSPTTSPSAALVVAGTVTSQVPAPGSVPYRAFGTRYHRRSEGIPGLRRPESSADCGGRSRSPLRLESPAHRPRKARTTMPARAPRIRLFAATALVLAAFALAGCRDGKGLKDEGPATTHSLHAPAGHTAAVRNAKRPPGREPGGLPAQRIRRGPQPLPSGSGRTCSRPAGCRSS